MADILAFTGDTRIPDSPEDVLEKAKGWGMERVVICGWKPEGGFVIGGSHSEIAEAVLLLEIGKARLLRKAEK